MARLPPRLETQPIFYPVLELEYARRIARDWNTKDAASGYAGFVTVFNVDDSVAGGYPIQTVGAAVHRELWVPAEGLPVFNAAIRGRIAVVEAHYGPGFVGPPPAW